MGLSVALAAVALLLVLELSDVLGSSLPGLRFQASSSLRPAKTPLDHTALFEPGASPGHGSSSGGGGASNFDFAIVDPSTGVITKVAPFAGDTLVSTPMVASGRDIVEVIGLQDTNGIANIGTAVAFVPGQPALRSLGRASYVVAGSRPGVVWLVVNPDYPNPPTSDSSCTVEEVTISGVVALDARPIPCGWRIDGASPHGLVVESGPVEAENFGDGPSTLSAWNPRTGGVEATYGSPSSDLSVDGDSDGVLLWNECHEPECIDNVTSLSSELTETLPSLPRGWNQLAPFSLSPNGHFAAVLAISDATRRALNRYDLSLDHSSPCCYFGVHALPTEVLIYNLRAQTLVEARPLTAASRPLMSWSPDGGWLFVTQDLSHIEAVSTSSSSEAVRVLPVQNDRYGGLDTPSESFLPVSR